MLLSGDRHIGALYQAPEGGSSALTEMTSSGLTQTFPGNREPGPNRLGAVYGAANFGTIDVDWWAETVTLSLRSENGEPVRRHIMPLGERPTR